MEVRFVKNYDGPTGKWVTGQRPDIIKHLAIELIQRGFAVLGNGKPFEAQQTADMVRKTKEANQQPIVVVVEDNSKTAPDEKGGKIKEA